MSFSERIIIISLLGIASFMLVFCKEETPALKHVSPDQRVQAQQAFRKGILLMRNEKPEMALTEFAVAVALNPNRPEHYHNMGLAQMILGQHKDAVQAFEKVSQLSPEDASAPFHKGLALTQLNKIDDALDAHHAAIINNPNHRDAYFHAGLIHYKQGDFLDAAKVWQRAARIKTTVDLEVNIGRAYFNAGELTLARRHFNNSLKIDAKHCESLFYLGRILDKKSNKDTARSYYRQAINCAPQEPMPYFFLGMLEKNANPDNNPNKNINLIKFNELTKNRPELRKAAEKML